ncbi:hypothetical protein A9Q84_16395 [Halobacteriovorax marinus]|uniref:Lipoprotein n=1 Tax=Halobacteriovorax marinus TaxID=97084 RepID=A0A1Y5F4B1_9BACT|nr:hypothetical protein A9Q84_16395 [Halobacteriovorax marinus]
MKFLRLLLFFFSYSAWCCEVVDITSEASVAFRQALIGNSDNSGVRVAFNGMKEMNNRHGLGGVNSSLDVYQKNLCNKLNSSEFKKSNPNVNVKITKTDFKGYFITCTPKSTCGGAIEVAVSKVPKPRFPDLSPQKLSELKAKPGYLPDSEVFNIFTSEGANYQESYIKARAKATYTNVTEPLHEFIDKEMKQGISRATSSMGLEAQDPKFMSKLSKEIEVFRSTGMGDVDKNFKQLINGLDSLMETPFANSDDIEKELSRAFTAKNSANALGYSTSTAQTGDDLFIVIKKGDGVEKIVGADARGLGVTNMTTRLTEYLSVTGGGASGFKSMTEVFKTSKGAMLKADKLMEKSLSTYNDIIVKELKNANAKGIDHILGIAHEKYAKMVELDPELMQIRGGAIDDCGPDNKLIMNRVTAIHNRLKLFEKAGLDGIFGASCLGTEYLLRLRGLK